MEDNPMRLLCRFGWHKWGQWKFTGTAMLSYSSWHKTTCLCCGITKYGRK